MNIWLLSPFSPLPQEGAHESRTAALSRYLTEAGHTVVWFSSDWDHRKKEIVAELAVPRRSLARKRVPSSVVKSGTTSPTLIPTPPYQKNISLRRLHSHRTWGKRLVRIAKKRVQNGEMEAPDMILASSPPLDAPKAAFTLQKTFGCRVKIDLTDLWPYTFERVFRRSEVGGRRTEVRSRSLPRGTRGSGNEHPLLKPLYRMAHKQWRKADGVSAMSREYLDEVLRIVPDQDTHLCYIGGNVRKWESEKVGRDEVGSKSETINQAETKCVSFLYLGALTDSYDFDTLFAAAQVLATEGHDFHIHIAGSGPLEDKLQLDTRVTFHGFLDEKGMQALCAQCDVGLNIIRPGLHITMPHKLNDYLCAGLPVINSLKGEAEQLLQDYQAGMTYTAGDAGSLKHAMLRYLKHKNAPESGAWNAAKDLLDREITYPRWASWIMNGCNPDKNVQTAASPTPRKTSL